MAVHNWSIMRWVNIVAFALTIIVNSLAGSTTIIGGKTTADVSEAYPTLITPAGYVFSIWGIIYALLGIFVIFQALPSQRGKEFHKKIGWLFVLSSLANIVWLFLWQFEYLVISVGVMFLLLLSLIGIYLRVGIGKVDASPRTKLAVHLPFSVYLGWITIASIANVASALVSINWGKMGLSAEIWASIVVVVALVITLLVVFTRKDIAYGLVIIWALLGIAVNQSAIPLVVQLTQISAVIVAVAIILMVILVKLRKNKSKNLF